MWTFFTNRPQREGCITSTDRTAEEQAFYILNRSAYPVRKTEEFKKHFSEKELKQFGDVPDKWSKGKEQFRKLWESSPMTSGSEQIGLAASGSGLSFGKPE